MVMVKRNQHWSMLGYEKQTPVPWVKITFFLRFLVWLAFLVKILLHTRWCFFLLFVCGREPFWLKWPNKSTMYEMFEWVCSFDSQVFAFLPTKPDPRWHQRGNLKWIQHSRKLECGSCFTSLGWSMLTWRAHRKSSLRLSFQHNRGEVPH